MAWANHASELELVAGVAGREAVNAKDFDGGVHLFGAHVADCARDEGDELDYVGRGALLSRLFESLAAKLLAEEVADVRLLVHVVDETQRGVARWHALFEHHDADF